MYFFGSDSSSASTPASNGSSLNGLSSLGGAVGSELPPKSKPPVGADGSDGAGFSPASFNTYFLSSVTLLYRLFFLLSPQKVYL
jgi:hypothetical protein